MVSLSSFSETFSPYSSHDIKNYFLRQRAKIRKRWGQNFLIDPNISRLIAEHVSREIAGVLASPFLEAKKAREALPLLEVGPGFGTLSKDLLKKGYTLYAVEIDPALSKFLGQKNWESKEPPYLLEADILSFFKGLLERGESFSFQRGGKDLEKSSQVGIQDKHIYAKTSPEERQRVEFACGNLPYSISTDFFRNFICLPGIKGGVFLVQKEYAQRILRKEGEASHSLGIFLHNYGVWKKCMDVGAKSFYPSPKVDSSLIVYRPHIEGLECSSSILEKLLRLSFGSRRKKLENNWKKKLTYYFPELTLVELLGWAEEGGIKADFRAEALSHSDFYFLSRKIEEKQRLL